MAKLDTRIGMDRASLRQAIVDHIKYARMQSLEEVSARDVMQAVALATRDRLAQRWEATRAAYREQDVKRVYYLSAEFLLGRALAQNLINLDLFETCREALAELDLELADVLEAERDPGLGNGGLGRLAACFMESLATLALPGTGYGIRYDYGIFEQHIEDGQQIERGDDWLRFGNPWEVPRHQHTVQVGFFGRVVPSVDDQGGYTERWVDAENVLGVPYDMPVAGFENDTVNTLRLWSARAAREFNLDLFNSGDYRRAVEAKALSESISKVLYPNDQSPEGKELRLKQQYFFVACSVHDLVRRFKEQNTDFSTFPDKVAIQLNDTHPAIAVAELMRVLVDQERLPWDQAWSITERTVGYTNHTLLPEALERWAVPLFARLLPRHLSIIYEINRRFLKAVHVCYPNDNARQRRMSIIEEGAPQHVRMAHLAVVGAHSVNGVAALHSELVQSHLLPDFAQFWPDKFNNKTNGVTPRRWMVQSNPLLTAAISARIGDGWMRELDQLEKVGAFAEDAAFRDELRGIKRANKVQLAEIIAERAGVQVDPDSVFDVQIKRIHEYKRQLLNCLHIVSCYLRIKDDPNGEHLPRTFIFGGKAAPGYAVAKAHIRLICAVADIVNSDPAVKGRLKVAFIPNYSVSLAERIIPATDISEQISMAGKEASGTGNMKFAMNGALTVGTLDGANIEIREAVGPENFFLFGLTAAQVRDLKPRYRPSEYIAGSETLSRVVDLIESGFFSPDEPQRFRSITDALRNHDEYLCCADFAAYVACHESAAAAYLDPERWTRMVVHNIANTGRFSSDRTIREYATDIWGVNPCPVHLG